MTTAGHAAGPGTLSIAAFAVRVRAVGKPPSAWAEILMFWLLVQLPALPTMGEVWDGNGDLGAGTYDFNTAANWNPDSVPDAQGAVADFYVNFAGDVTITLSSDVTLGTLSLGDSGASGDSFIVFGNPSNGRIVYLDQDGTGPGKATINLYYSVWKIEGADQTVEFRLQDDLIIDVKETLYLDKTFNNKISGSGTITKTGPGSLQMEQERGRKSNIGDWYVQEGTLYLSEDRYRVLGNASNNIHLTGGYLKVRTDAGVEGTDKKFYFENAASFLTYTIAANGVHKYAGPWTGPEGARIVGGAANFVVSLTNTTNDFGGSGKAVTLENIQLLVAGDGALGNSANKIVMDGSSDGIDNYARTRLMFNASSGTMTANRNIELTKDGFSYGLDAGNGATLDVTGTVVDTGSGTAGNLIINSANIVSNGGSWAAGTNFWNPGSNSTVVLSGVCSYSGATVVANGTLVVDGSLSAGGDAVSVESGATLGGTGTISRDVTVAGGGYMTLSADEPLKINGNLTFGGAVDLVGVTGTPKGGQCTILENDGVEKVVFSNYAEGDLVKVSKTYCTIRYAGGDGNDVVLSAPGSVITIL